MSAIGSITCTFVKGTPPNKKQRLEVWTVPGINGVGAQAMGYSDSKFTIRAILYSTVSGVSTWRQQLEAAQGTIVSITNDLGWTITGCLITAVGQVEVVPAAIPGSTVVVRGEVEISGVVI
jgi:hypothetical protein